MGRAAVEYAVKNRNAVMPVIVRANDRPYRWSVQPAPLADIANHERTMPDDFIREDGYGLTDAARRYLAPLIRGESPPRYGRDGLPKYVQLRLDTLPPRLPPFAA